MDSKTLKLAARRAALVCVFPGWLFTVNVAKAVEPEEFQLGEGGSIAPHVVVALGTDSNPLRANEGSEESLLLRVQPSVSYLLRRRNNRLEFGYAGDYNQYLQDYCQTQVGVDQPGDCLPGSPTFDSASYFDQRLSLEGFLEVTSRLRARLEAFHQIRHQPLGTGLSANNAVLGSLTTPDEWNISTARAELSYGAFQARGEIRAGVTFSDRELETELNTNLDAQSSTTIAPYVSLLYRIGSRTQLFGSVGTSAVRDSISFSDDGAILENLERDITRLSFGAELANSSVTSGRISVSRVTEDFLSNNRDLQFLGFDIDLTWRPRRFSTVTISGGRETESGLFDDDIAISTTFGVNWVHFWRERLSSAVEVEFTNNEDVDPFSNLSETNDAEDTSWSFRLQGNYNLRRFLDVGGYIVIDSRDGRGETRDFNRTQIGIAANATI